MTADATPDPGDALIAVVDQGSTSTKAALVDAAGRRLAVASRPVERTVAGARIEHDPESLAASVESCLEELLAAAPAGGDRPDLPALHLSGLGARQRPSR